MDLRDSKKNLSISSTCISFVHKSIQFVLMASAYKGVKYRQFPVESTLKTHFFGRDGRHKLTFQEFSSFLAGLQREVNTRTILG